MLRQRQGDLAGSVDDFSQAIEHGDADAGVFFNRAVALDGLGRREEAIEDCTRAIDLDPEHANAYNSRGLVRMMLGRLDEASSDLDRAIQLLPDWNLPHVNRAQMAVYRSDWKAAVADYSAAIEKTEKRKSRNEGPLLAKLYWNRGRARRELGDTKGGAADQRVALQKDPTLGPA